MSHFASTDINVRKLGWPSGRMQEELFDETGSRPIPAYPEPGVACVSLYGDSFTFGVAVDDTHAWSNLLSRKLGCRVANYGVPGFGLDQALLYFESKDGDEAPIVLFPLRRATRLRFWRSIPNRF